MIAAGATAGEHCAMSTTEPQAAGAEPPKKHRSPWIWVSAVLLVVAAGLLIWALMLRSDRDDAQQQAKQLQAQVDQGKDTGGVVLTAVKAAYDELAQQLGATNEDLAAVKGDLDTAKQDAAQAEEDAAAAADKAAAAADDATEKAKAEADQAKAEAQALESKATIASDCAKAYVSAIGSLFEGGNVRDQLSTVRGDLEGITADCKASFSGE
jgi:flagellar basal body-associated protein FliL